MKDKRPTISPNFNFLGQLLDFEKKIKTPELTLRKSEVLVPPEEADPGPCPGAPPPELLEPLALPCVLDPSPDERLLARALSGLTFSGGPEDGVRPQRSFSLDIKAFGGADAAAAPRALGPCCGSADSPDFYRASALKDAGSKACQFSPVEEVSEQSTPEHSPDKEEAAPETPAAAPPRQRLSGQAAAAAAAAVAATSSRSLQRSGSLEESAAACLLGLSRSQQHLAKPGGAGVLKGWHSDILLGPVSASASASTRAGGWCLSDPTHFLSPSAILNSGGVGPYGRGHGAGAVRRRGRRRADDRGDSRRSWHEESSFEKQLKRRSCQMEFGGGRSGSRSREDVARAASQSSFSGSLELIQVS